jgi:hypothetical protein
MVDGVTVGLGDGGPVGLALVPLAKVGTVGGTGDLDGGIVGTTKVG